MEDEYLIYRSGGKVFKGFEGYTVAPVCSPIFPSLDCLSFSPSLVLILSLVDFTDLSKCRLVNRRFYCAIKKNASRMPRLEAHIHVVQELDPRAITVELYIPKVRRSTTYHIRNECGFRNKKHYAGGRGRNEDISPPARNILEGLLTVLEPLLLRYHCGLSIFISSSSDDNIPLEWFTAIANLSKRCRSSCVSLYLPARSDLFAIPSIILGLKFLTLRSPEDVISRLLPPFFKMKMCPRIDVELSTVEQLKHLEKGVRELIGGWQRGDYRMPTLLIKYIDTSNPHGSGPEDDWPYDQLCHYFRSLESQLDFPRNQSRLNAGMLEYSISRPSDDRNLEITHRKCRIRIVDILQKDSKRTYSIS